ncbi:MAG: TRAP transporter large permease subunit [Deltaproteobacteria bacterium]|nr:TRAP transporter large permease subunit [Deltaproteobacteria bacterium]MBM4325231.1 TRAP transporter large permease subunit [Deltaproteobacteria bacterium]
MSEYLPLLMFPAMLLSLFAGFPVAFSLMGIAFLFGMIGFEWSIFPMLIRRIYGVADNYVLAAVPLFIFMGTVLERSGIAGKLFDAISLWTGRLKGGLAIATVLMCTIIAACTGIIGASEVMVGVMVIPVMLKRNYQHALICGTICAGGSLGTLIPPSVVTVVYGPAAGISVGRLLIASIFPGLLLSSLYIIYIALRSYINPLLAPAIPPRELQKPMKEKLFITATALVPPLLLIFAVMGSIVLGFAAPTEAAALGAFGALILTAAYGKLTLKALKETVLQTLRISSMMMMILAGGFMFSGVFLGMGGGAITEKILMGLPFGRIGILILFLLIAFAAGFVLDWASILLIFIPIFSPIIDKLGFDPIWFGILFIMMIQTSYLSPPMAPAIFYLKSIVPPEVTMKEMFQGVVPFLIIQVIGILITAIFPPIVLWLPSKLIGW